MEPVDGLKAVDVLCLFPVGVVVADLFNEILKFISSYTSVENLVDDVLFFIVDYYRWWRGVPLSRKGVVSDWAEERDVLHWVHFDVAGKIKLVRPVEDNFQDFERFYTSMVQLPAWSLCSDIFCVKPYLVSFFEGRC